MCLPAAPLPLMKLTRLVVFGLSMSASLAFANPAAGVSDERVVLPAAPGSIDGRALYQARCAACHDNTETTRAPSRENLKGMSFQFVNYALTQGKMKDMGAGLTAEQRAQVVSFVTGGRDPSQVTADWAKDMMCTGARAAVDLEGPDAATSTHFGYDANNTRKLTAKQAGLTTAQMGNMELAWAIAFPDSTTMRPFIPMPACGTHT